MSYSISAASRKSSEIITCSTGSDPDGWRRWWREQSRIDGIHWETLCWHPIGALTALRRFCEAPSS
jgi:hypothetical protein